MERDASSADTAQAALAALGVLNKLILEAGLCADRKELTFRICNKTIELTRYQRACLFDVTGKKPKLLGVSGQSSVPADSELGAVLTGLVASLADLGTARILTKGDFPEQAASQMSVVAAPTGGLDVIWLPIRTGERTAAGLWLERWGGEAWREAELALLGPLALGYGVAWDKCGRLAVNPSKWLNAATSGRTPWAILLAVLLVLSLRVSLRVAAPCEVAPEDPFVVTAPLNGVIAEVFVRPGQAVKKNDLLFAYDKRVAMEDLKVARQQVQIVQSSLTRSNMQAFLDPKARSESSLLELKLEQEKTRLELAEQNAAKLEALAEVEGLAVLDDPSDWRGRPVAVGEKVMSIVDPHQTKLRIYLPIDDNVPFDQDKPVTVYLNAAPESALHASLVFVAQNITVTPQGVPAVLAEGQWSGDAPPPRIGLQGTAVVYGKSVSLLYWLTRKPLAWARRTLGM